ncbi:RHS repeat-associated core domain-containing protein [Gilliamella sp. Nev3-1]|uniref:RHS repeat-associated core domain-containing protein n=4 Tax=Gilliamella TaxID=1193503 RepID=UPI0009BE1DFB|nr:RHS repeat-associated core domain-containing protein [Gilliamella apicola]
MHGNAQQDNIKLYWYQNDHLGTPIALTGSLGDTLYECQYNAYGQIINETYHQDDIDSLPDNPLRFQGQYYDEETGLHYNLNRYYDPFTGRYITQDPLGILGGLNSYQYAGSDPINWIDPLGLIKVENNGFEEVAGEGAKSLQQLAKTEMDNLAALYNNKNIHPKDFTISVNGKILVADKNVSIGAPVFTGASEADVMAYFKRLSGVDTMPTAKIIPGKGTIYSIKITEGPNAGSNITLRNFSESVAQTKAKWTIDIKNPSINIRKQSGDEISMNFKKIYNSILESAFGYSMGTMWQHLDNYTKDIKIPYEIRKDLFFRILEKLIKDGHIRLARNGIFLSGTIEEQINSIKNIWPPYPPDNEDDDLDDVGMWFYVKLNCGIVWITSNGQEVWT